MRTHRFLLVLMLMVAGCGELPSLPFGGPPTAGDNSPQSQQLPLDSKTGAIAGILLDRGGNPMVEMSIYVADVLDGPTPNSKMLGLDITRAPRAFTDSTGRFVVPRVPPGSHSLILRTPAEDIPIPPPNGDPGGAILVEVKAGQTTDVGSLRVQRPRVLAP